jgi:general secretion pathway protein L
VTWNDIRSAFFAFLRWWGSQLIEILPDSWKSALQGLTAVSVLDVREPLWKLAIAGRDRRIATLNGDLVEDELRQQFRRLFPEGMSNSIEVILSPETALLRRILVPAAATNRLRSVVQLQLDRLSPFRGDDVVFDCELGEPCDAPATEVAVDVAIIPKTALQELEQRIRRIGLVPSSFKIGDTGFAVKASGVPWTPARQTQVLLLAAACAIWVAAFWIAPSMNDAEIATLQDEISSLAPEVTHAEELRQELGRYDLPPQALTADRARALDVLLALTRTLPDQVHLTSLALIDRRLTLRGTAPSNLAVRSLLMRTGLFEKSHIAGGQNGDNFSFEMALRPTPTSGAFHR